MDPRKGWVNAGVDSRKAVNGRWTEGCRVRGRSMDGEVD